MAIESKMKDGAQTQPLKAAISKAITMEPGKHYVNPGDEEQMEVQGFRPSRPMRYLNYIGYVLTLGILRLVYHWLPHVHVWSQNRPTSLAKADIVVLLDLHNKYHVAKVKTITREGTGVKLKRKSLQLFKNKHAKEMNVYGSEGDASLIRFFLIKRVKYIFDPEAQTYTPLRGLDYDHKLSFFHTTDGISEKDQQKRRVLYGRNLIDVHVTPVIVLLFKEALSPFYIFQVFSMAVWYADQYEIYASCIVVVTSMSIIITIYQTRLFERTLRNTIKSHTNVSVCRGGNVYEKVSSEDLVPGDIIEIPRSGCDMLCDAVLITGNCIVNESLLTGESVPVTKTSLPNPRAGLPPGAELADEAELNLKHHSRHVLFCGTHVIQTRFYGNQKVKAVVLRTGFSTSKGELVRSILFPKPADFKFERHSYYFVMFLAFLALLGFVYTVVLMVNNGDEAGDIILRSLDLITITVPPALPAALAVGVVFSQRRLKTKSVYCISPRGINVCGTIDAVCFDKTGTLTEDGLDMHGVVRVHKSMFEPLVTDVPRLGKGPLLTAMAATHSLTIIEDKIVGDPLDLIMFNSTEWELLEPGPDETRFDMMTPTVVRPKSSLAREADALKGEDVGIVRQFPFSSSLQRMSVVTRKLGANNFELYVKGSPEMVSSLSKKETIPYDFHQVLEAYTQKGFRVLALAHKALPSKLNYVKVQRINREQVENDLTFLGLLIMENRLKPQSGPVIQELLDANIRTIMVTGDNMLTALSVARECYMVDVTDRIILVQAYPPEANSKEVSLEFVYTDDSTAKVEEVFSADNRSIQIDEESQRFRFALTGKTWAIIHKHCPDLLTKIVVRGAVFARMAPEQKGQLVETLQEVGYFVGMCGDGANDCGALKVAHMGISLSEAEASVASPFTSKNPTIECVPQVVKEGRAALTTTFGVFKYIACYSMTQFVSVLILYWIGANLTDYEFLYIDFFLITSFSITFSWTGPYHELVVERPLVSLLSLSPILSIITQIMVSIAAQAIMFVNVQQQPWFTEFQDNDEDDYMCYENAAVFFASSYQYIILAITFSKGKPFRNSILSNYYLVLNIVVALAVTLWLNIYPTDTFSELMEIEQFPSYKYKALFIGVAVVNFLLSYMLETFLVDNIHLRKKIQACCKGCLPSQELGYHKIQNEFAQNPSWPPVTEKKANLAEIFQKLDSVDQSMPIKDSARITLDDILENPETDNPRAALTGKGDEPYLPETPDSQGGPPDYRSAPSSPSSPLYPSLSPTSERQEYHVHPDTVTTAL